MPASYPSALKTFTTKTNKVDLVDAAHINDAQLEIAALEAAIGLNPKGSAADLVTRLAVNIDTAGLPQSGTSFPVSPVARQMFYRTDVDTYYIRNTANTTWLALGGSNSNYLFQYEGCIDKQGASKGEVINASLVPSGATGNYRFLQSKANAYEQVWSAKWIKIAGVNTITVYCRLWAQSNSNGQIPELQVSVGGQTGSVTATINVVTPTWYSFTIDVTSLTTNTAYDVLVNFHDSAASGVECFCANIIGFGS